LKIYQFNQGLFLIILLKLILFFSPSIFAKCKNESYLIFPPSGCVPANARFIVEGFSNGQLKIEKVKTGDVILTSHLNTIQLIPDKMNTGQFLVSQLLLKPAEPLLQGTLYFLSINGIDSSYFSFHGDTKKKGWYSNGSLDIEKPVWLENPVVVDRNELGHDDNSPSWIRIITKIRD
jgi:hypothetical protein